MFVGTRGVDLAFTSIPTAYTEFNGELGTVYMLNKPVSKVQARGMFLLGPNYMFNFDNWEKESRPIFSDMSLTQEDHKAIHEVCDGSLTSSLLVNLSACVMDSKKTCVLDDTPVRFRQRTWPGGNAKDALEVKAVNGQLLAGTYVCSTKQIASVVDSLGGISLFFPLLPQMDLVDGSEAGDAQASEVFDRELYLLLSNAIRGSSLSREFMETQNGFDVIAYLMQKSKLENVSVLFVEKLIQLLEDASLSPALHQQIFKAFVMNSAFWMNCSAAIQKEVYSYVLTVLKNNENKGLISIIKGVGLEGFLHIIRYFYSDVAIAVPEEVCLAVTNDV